MINITVKNINETLLKLNEVFSHLGETSKNLISLPEPVSITVTDPRQRCLLWPQRMWNPFLAYHYAMWFLSGRKDMFVKMENFEEDGLFNSGVRLRNFDMLGIDALPQYANRSNQLTELLKLLKINTDTSGAVLQLYDYRYDGYFKSTATFVTELNIVFTVRDKNLNMVVISRSNNFLNELCNTDMVRFSILHEFVAANTSLRVGWCTYVMTDLFTVANDRLFSMLQNVKKFSSYEKENLTVRRMIKDKVVWQTELFEYVKEGDNKRYFEPWFDAVMRPLYQAWKEYKNKNFDLALDLAYGIEAEDVRFCAVNWLRRKKESFDLNG